MANKSVKSLIFTGLAYAYNRWMHSRINQLTSSSTSFGLCATNQSYMS